MSAFSRTSRARSKQSSAGSGPLDPSTDTDIRVSTVSKSITSTLPEPRKTTSTIEKGAKTDAPINGDTNMSGAGSDVEDDTSANPTTLNGSSRLPFTSDGVVGHDDGQSSSLSEIEEGASDDQSEGDVPDDAEVAVNDSEAETERLENSPHKTRKHKAVILGSGLSQTFERSPSNGSNDLQTKGNDADAAVSNLASTPRAEEDNASNTGTSKSNGDAEQTTAATSLEDSAGEGVKLVAPTLSKQAGQKRKHSAGEANDVEEPATKKTGSIKDGVNGDDADHQTELEDESPSMSGDDDVAAEDEVPMEDDDAPLKEVGRRPKRPASKATRGRKGRRKVGKAVKEERDADGADANKEKLGEGDENADEDENGIVAEEGAEEEADGDAEVEEEGDVEGEAEVAAKNEEELQKKRSAMDSLSTIENHFATFRDRLYDERLNQLTNELTLLSQPEPTHPEFHAMLRCIDARQDEKIELEQTLLRYKLKALQIKSVAERSQIHSQYFQLVRAIRERKLEEVGEQWYQIQRDRRGWDGSVPDYAYKFPTRRSQQIMQQTSYNLEVSILSGVAKYVGFPAAPSIDGARPSEIDEDLQTMGIKTQARPSIQSNQPLRASFSVPSITRPSPAAEEQFLEQTPWANPRHPAHQRPLQRQVSQQARTGSPFTVPAVQRHSKIGESAVSESIVSPTIPYPTGKPPSQQQGTSLASGLIADGQGTLNGSAQSPLREKSFSNGQAGKPPSTEPDRRGSAGAPFASSTLSGPASDNVAAQPKVGADEGSKPLPAEPMHGNAEVKMEGAEQEHGMQGLSEPAHPIQRNAITAGVGSGGFGLR